MNAFGIDYDQVHCCVALRERCEGATMLRMVSDGARTLIPLAIAGRQDVREAQIKWGSRALGHGNEAQALSRASLGVPGPWLTSPGASGFVAQLSEHLCGYLGQVNPNRENGYATVVATLAQDNQAVPELKSLFGGAGFGEADIIFPPQALLCDWLSRVTEGTALPRVIVGVVIGDAAVSALAVELKVSPGSPPSLEAVSPASWFLPVGHEHLARRVVSMVWERAGVAPKESPPDAELALSDAAVGFALSMGRVRKEEVVKWMGPLANQMFTELRLQRREVESWPEPQLWMAELPCLVQDAVGGLGYGYRPELVILGGIGACWPFAEAALEQVGFVEVLPQAWESVARGSAWWPAFAAEWPAIGAHRQTVELAEGRETSETHGALGGRLALRPPWERD
jgi:hypothetical protein